MANILDPTENLSPVSGLKGIYTKLIEVIRRLNVLLANSGSSKVYKALITQGSTNAPVVVSNGTGANTPLVNTLGGTPVWSYNSAGNYSLTLAGAFADGKTNVKISYGSDGAENILNWYRNSNDEIVFLTLEVGTGVADNIMLYPTSVEIEVFP